MSVEKTRDFQEFVGVDVQVKRNRLLTLRSFPRDYIKKIDLAEAGFFYYGKNDIVECFNCGLNLGCWSEGNVPKEEHKKHNPKCVLLAGVSKDIEEEPRQVVAYHPSLSSLDSRQRTFDIWPPSIKKLVKPLVEAGFFYTGNGDDTVCFFCSGMLDSWTEDLEPWERHALTFPTCEYVRVIKGLEFIVNTKFKRNTQNPNYLRPAHKYADVNREICVVCRVNMKRYIFKPCGHFSVCDNCLPSDGMCPVCDLPYENYMKAYNM